MMKKGETSKVALHLKLKMSKWIELTDKKARAQVSSRQKLEQRQ